MVGPLETSARRPSRGRVPLPPLTHEPGLDGLRALAVAAVCCYHARFAWAGGGFLGVSLFFTLSGFLITSLLVREHSGGRIDLGRFWSRRFRRLMPAAVVTLGLTVVMGWLGAFDTQQLRALRGDVPAALFWVVNWRFIAAGQSYGAAQASPSPLEHFWSLSVEEQFYFVFPLLIVGVLAYAGRSRRLLPWVLGVVGALSAAWCGILAAGGFGGTIDRAYFGTDTRLFELVAGALLACALATGTRLRGQIVRAVAWVAGLAALAATLVLWRGATVQSPWLYPWGLLLCAACSAALITAAMQPGPLRAVLSLRPLGFIGRISYGIYLLHWPIFRWLSPSRLGWGPWPTFVLQMAVTVAVAAAMHRFVEEPVRRGRALRSPLPIIVGPVSYGVVLLAALSITSNLPIPVNNLDQPIAQGADAKRTTPIRVLVVGDQVAGSLGDALATVQHNTKRPQFEVHVDAAPWCGLVVGGYVRNADGTVERDTDRCGAVRDRWVADEVQLRPDVVLLGASMRDVADRKFDLDGSWITSNEPIYGDFLRTELSATRDALAAGGAKVVWVTLPHVRNPGTAPTFTPPPPANDEARMLHALHQIQAERGVTGPGHAEDDDTRVDGLDAVIRGLATDASDRVADLAAWLATRPGGALNPADRTGGVGLSPSGGTAAADWLAGQLRGLRRSLTTSVQAPDDAASTEFPTAAAPAPRRRVVAGRPVRVLVAGDSVANGIGSGLIAWSKGAGRGRIEVSNSGQYGCPIARNGLYRFLGQTNEFIAKCDWAGFFPEFLNSENPDVVMLQTGIWEVVDRVLRGDKKWRHLGDPLVDHYVESELLSAIDTLGASGANVALVTYPHLDAGANQGFSNLPESDPARIDRLNAIVRDAAARRPGVVTVIDFQAWLAAQPGGELGDGKRTDGIHFTDGYDRVIAAWLGPKLERIGRGQPPG